MDSPVIGSHNGIPPASHLDTEKSTCTIGVKNLLGMVKDNHPEFLPDNLREHYEN